MLCSKCRLQEARSSSGWCLACKREWAKANRLKWCQLSDEQRAKANCRSHTKMLQRRGAIPKGPCEGCHAEKAQNHHHWGYERPRWYIRLCVACHAALETRIKAEAEHRRIKPIFEQPIRGPIDTHQHI